MALTCYYGGINPSVPPVEKVFEMITYETEQGLAEEERKFKHLDRNYQFDIEVTSLKEYTNGR